MFQRNALQCLISRMKEPRRFIQVLSGPRQAGKTTIAHQMIEATSAEARYASADEPTLKDRVWVEQQWETARLLCRTHDGARPALLVLDEIQKITGWSETVKRLWDEDSVSGLPLQVVLLGSSPLLVQRGLTESLAGRFEVLLVTHWSYAEMRDAFGWDVEEYVFYGGYPGAASLIGEPQRWARYILDSLIETSVSRDVLLMTRVDKPALLRRLFDLGCTYSGQVLSYQKMVGQLQDAGNTSTLAHYLDLLHGAGLLLGLQKYAGQPVRRRGSSPKLLVMNTALMSATSGRTFEEARVDHEWWGRLAESAVGAALVNAAVSADIGVFYWASRNREVDFVLHSGKTLVAIEVKTGRRSTSLPGIEAFSRDFDVTRKLLVGGDGIPLDEFFLTPINMWLK